MPKLQMQDSATPQDKLDFIDGNRKPDNMTMTWAFALIFTMGLAFGVLATLSAWDYRDATLMSNLDSDCKKRYGDKAHVAYSHTQRAFYCWR